MTLKGSILLLLAASYSLSATDITIRGSNHAEYWVFVDEELDTLNYKEHLEDKLKLSLNYGDITLKGVFFLWTPSLPVQERLNYFDYTAIYSKDPVNILYGTFYTTFGRGLVLNAFLDEDFRNDNSLYGVKADFKYLSSQLTLLSGEPRCIFFEENKYTIENNTSDQIRGINFRTKLIPKTTLGGRYVRINQITDLTPKAFTELFGGDIGFIIGPFDSYLEYARQWGSDDVIGGRLRGDGILFTTSFAIPGLGISFQYLDYDSIGFGTGYRYNEPPTPIKSGLSVNRGFDEVGYGVSFITSPFEFLTLELDHNKISTHDETVNKFKEITTISDNMDGVLEQVAKMTINTTYDLEINGGVERVLKQGIELPIEKKVEIKPNIELTYNFGTFFIETGYEHNFISSDTSDYYDHAAFFSIGKPELFVLTLRYERRNRIPEWLVFKYGDETVWPLAELSLDLTHRHNIIIRVGAEKGGLVCTGGRCRFEEPFKGVKLVLTSIL